MKTIVLIKYKNRQQGLMLLRKDDSYGLRRIEERGVDDRSRGQSPLSYL